MSITAVLAETTPVTSAMLEARNGTQRYLIARAAVWESRGDADRYYLACWHAARCWYQCSAHLN